MTRNSHKRPESYYAERLITQAILDPDIDTLDKRVVRNYIKQEARKLCLNVKAVTTAAMQRYHTLRKGDFTTYRSTVKPD